MSEPRLEIGRKVVSARRTVTEADIIIFAGLSGDFHPVHTNDVFASTYSVNRRRIAHGLLVLSICEGLFIRTNFLDWERVPILSLGYDSVKFTKPVCIGDTIYSEFAVTKVRDSRKRTGDKIVTLKFECKNQRDEVVCEYDHTIIVLSMVAR